MLLVATYSATTMIGAAIGGVVIGAALGFVFGSMIALTNIAYCHGASQPATRYRQIRASAFRVLGWDDVADAEADRDG